MKPRYYLIVVFVFLITLEANSKPETFYEYDGLSLNTKLTEFKTRYPKAFHQFMFRNSKQPMVLTDKNEKEFYDKMLKEESIYSVSTNEIKNNKIVPLSDSLNRAKLLIKNNRLHGMELNIPKDKCFNLSKKYIDKYGRQDSRNVATGSSIWFWMTGTQSLVIDEKLCNVHINWDKKSTVPGAKPKK